MILNTVFKVGAVVDQLGHFRQCCMPFATGMTNKNVKANQRL